VKLVGFGCSFTYGSELVDPNIDPNDHWANNRYRNEHSWLGRLANKFGCVYDNLSQPANSNFAISYQVANYIQNSRNDKEHIVICVGWSDHNRMSWYSDHWMHNGFVTSKDIWANTKKEWLVNSTDDSNHLYTNTAKLFVNSICNFYNIPILQFNALGDHSTTVYENYFNDGGSMNFMLNSAEQEDSRLNLFASGGHPNESGHEYFTIRLHEFAKQRII
jgi:hypothetical protein